MNQPESMGKGGLVWSLRTTKVQGRLPAQFMLKKKSDFKDAFKLFIITDRILDEIVLQTNNYAKRHYKVSCES